MIATNKYRRWLADPKFSKRDINVEVSRASGSLAVGISLNIFNLGVEFKDGYCWVFGINEWLSVTYRSAKDWDVWNAHRAELEELKEEQRQQLRVEQALFKAQDEHLKQQAAECLNRKEYDQVLGFLERRVDLIRENEHLRKHVPGEWQILDEAMQLFYRFPDVESAVQFLGIHAKVPGQFATFGERYLFWNRRRPRAEVISEVDKIFHAAVRKFPMDIRLLGRICLFWERESAFSLALGYCELALEKSLDLTLHNLFVKRLKRLQKKAGVSREVKGHV